VNGQYDADKANHKAYVRRWRSKYQGMKIVRNPTLQDFVEYELYDDQSPEMIAGLLKHRQKKLECVSKDSIYRYIKSPYGRNIETHRARLKRKRRRTKPRSKPWKDRVFIDKRPAHINTRRRIGDTEADFIVSGKSGKGIVLVVVIRKLRVTFLEQIINVSAANVHRAYHRIKKRFPEWRSATTDNDILLQHFKELEQQIEINVYFCFPGHAWEKPQVENRNQYIRRYIPKGSDLSRYPKRFFRDLEEKLNRRIMKVLKYRRPKDLLEAHRKRKQRRGAVERKKK